MELDSFMLIMALLVWLLSTGNLKSKDLRIQRLFALTISFVILLPYALTTTTIYYRLFSLTTVFSSVVLLSLNWWYCRE